MPMTMTMTMTIIRIIGCRSWGVKVSGSWYTIMILTYDTTTQYNFPPFLLLNNSSPSTKIHSWFPAQITFPSNPLSFTYARISSLSAPGWNHTPLGPVFERVTLPESGYRVLSMLRPRWGDMIIEMEVWERSFNSNWIVSPDRRCYITKREEGGKGTYWIRYCLNTLGFCELGFSLRWWNWCDGEIMGLVPIISPHIPDTEK